jgi:hypothetical protein
MSSKPRIFFGSSQEGLAIARVLAAYVGPDFTSVLWDEGFFTAGRYNLDELERAAREHDFAVFCGTPDDILFKRGTAASSLRDNIQLEFGIFLGALGRKKTFLVAPRADDLALPTDLAGLTMVRYDPGLFMMDERDKLAALQRTAAELRNALHRTWCETRNSEVIELKKRLAAARSRATARILAVIVQFRDLLIELPAQVIESIADPKKFDEVKREAASKVDRLAAAFSDDAREAAAKSEFDGLVSATKDAVLRLPHPLDFVPDEEYIKSLAAEHLQAAIREYTEDRSPVGYLQRAIESEIENRLRALADAYRHWWNRSERTLRRSTEALQEALIRGLLETGHDPSARALAAAS